MSFDLGQTVATPEALRLCEEYGVPPLALLVKHSRLEPGCLDKHDQKLNKEAITSGDRIVSAFLLKEGDPDSKIYVITSGTDDEGRRESTCIMTPEDY